MKATSWWLELRKASWQALHSVLRLTDVEMTYHDGAPIMALRPTSFEVTRGEHIAITGPSGSGKSTLLNLLGLLDRPSGGAYAIDGVETTQLTESTRTYLRARVFGFVFQAFHLLPGRTVIDNVRLGMIYRGTSSRERDTRAKEALASVGMVDRATSDPRLLSGGERQRVAIARALAAHPSVLLCDEPTGNLDSGNAERLMELLTTLNAAGLTLVVVTHEPSVASCASRQIRVLDGQLSESTQGASARR